ncbi:hypothetical protein KC640_00500 [Candidatus Dojkabacteria bacterium]|uniref:Uncharacterized protein n=1 Tax=Candidatus Dojkabacteria bacterium TaxID=2099670 RepID=A0A955I6N5_9BACT|nr:hypothetical protein [Candidatus Dojkabacteria bacterium]
MSDDTKEKEITVKVKLPAAELQLIKNLLQAVTAKISTPQDEVIAEFVQLVKQDLGKFISVEEDNA